MKRIVFTIVILSAADACAQILGQNSQFEWSIVGVDGTDDGNAEREVVAPCCLGAGCSMLTEDACTLAGGTWLGPAWPPCPADPCFPPDHEPGTLSRAPAQPGSGGGCVAWPGGSQIYSTYLGTGTFVYTQTDLFVEGRGLNFTWTRTYRSRFGPDSTMGKNWDHSYNIRLELYGQHRVLRDGTGRADRYLLQSPGVWARDEYFRELRINPDSSYTLLFPDKSRWIFNRFDATPCDGVLLFIIDRNGNTLSMVYNSSGRLVQVRDTLDRVHTVTYNSKGLVSTVTDFTGRQVVYAYDTAGNLVSARSPIVSGTPNMNDFPAGKTTTYTYTSGFADSRLNHNLLSIIDPKGQAFVTNTYAATSNPADPDFDRVIRQTWGGATDRIDVVYVAQTPGPANNQATLKAILNDRVGNVNEWFFDALRRCVMRREFTGRAVPNQPTTDTSNRPTGQLRATDPAFFETRWQYNADALVVRTDYANGSFTTESYDTGGPLVRGNLLTRVRHPGPLGGDQASLTETWTYETGLGGCGCGTDFVKTHTDARGNTVTHTYDAAGNRTRTVDRVSSVVQDWEYNSFGQMTAHVHPSNGPPLNHRRRDEFQYFGPADGPSNGYLRRRIEDVGGFQLTTTFEVDPRGNVIREIDPKGQDTLIDVNALDQVVRRRKPVVSGVRYAETTHYDANDNVVRVEIENRDENGVLQANSHWTTNYAYDILNRRTRVEREVEAGEFVVTETVYDANGNRIRERTPLAMSGEQPNNTIDTEYDERDLPFKTIHAKHDPSVRSTTQLNYDLVGNVAERLVGLEGPTSVPPTPVRLWSYTYDGYGRSKTTTDPMGNVRTMVYDANGNVVSSRFDGELVDVPGGAGNVRLSESTHVFDAMNRRTATHVQHFECPTQLAVGDGVSSRTTTYTDTSRVLTMTDDRGHTRTSAYDRMNRPASVTDARGDVTATQYDANSNPTTQTAVEVGDLPGTSETFQVVLAYDSNNRPTHQVDNVGNVWTAAYDSRDNRVLTHDPLSRQRRSVFDGLSRRTDHVIDMDGDGAAVNDPADIRLRSGYDRNSRPTGRTDDNDNTTVTRFDPLDRRFEDVFASGLARTQVLDVHGNAIGSTDANGTMTSATYDLLDRVTSRTFLPGPGVAGDTTFETFAYDGLGRVVEALNDRTRVTRSYDSLGNVISETQELFFPTSAPALTMTATHDGMSNRTFCTFPSGRTVTWEYDALDRVRLIDDLFTGIAATYDYIGDRVQRRTLNNGAIRCDYEYNGVLGVPNQPGDAGFRKVSRMTYVRTQDSVVLDDRRYAWDGSGDKRESRDLTPGGPQYVHTYDADAAHRLRRTRVRDATLSLVLRDTTYDLDGVGNRLSVSGPGTYDPGSYALQAGSPSYDFEMNQYTTVPYSGVARSYDANGSLLHYCEPGGMALTSRFSAAGAARAEAAELAGGAGGPALGGGEMCWMLMYDVHDRLVSSQASSGGWTEYVYDAFGRRVATISPEGLTRYALDGWQEVEEWRPPPDGMVRYYVFGAYLDEPLLRYGGAGPFHYLHDDQFNTVALVESLGGVVERYAYDDFGRPIGPTTLEPIVGCPSASGIGNSLLFQGRRYDCASGRYHYRFRELDPRAGRFMQRDPIGIWTDESNLGNGLAFLNHNPMSGFDPFGLANTVGVCGPDVTAALAQVPAALEDLYRGGDIQRQVAQCAFGAEQFDIKPLKHHMGGVANGERLVKSDSPCQKNDKAGDRDQCENTVTLGGRCFYAGTVNYAAYGFIQRICYDNMTKFGKWAYFERDIRAIMWVKINLYKGPGNWIWLRGTADNRASAIDMALAAFDVANNGRFAVPAEERTQCRPCEEKWSGKFHGNWVIWEWAVK